MSSPGDRLADRYELIEPIGSGRLTTVWRARDTRLRRAVAVKILRPQFAEDLEFVRRFESEAHDARSLANFYVATVYDTGVDGSARFVVMELVDGPTLADVLARDGALAPARAIEIAASAARALAAAHHGGLVHGDVKPANLLMGSDGRARLADFGIAQALGVGRLATVGLARGSTPYTSPEQILGKEAQAAGDIYSLGVVLYQMLHGHLPRRADRKPANPGAGRALDADLPAGLGAIVARALAIRPADRYSAQAFAEALDVVARNLRQTRVMPTESPAVVAVAAPGIVTRAEGAPSARPSVRPEAYASTGKPKRHGASRRERRRPRTGAAPAIAGLAAIGAAAAVALLLLSSGAKLIGGTLEATATAPPIAAGRSPSTTEVPSAALRASSAPILVESPSVPAVPSSPVPTARPSASPRPTPTRAATPSLGGPSAAVADFYNAVEAHDWNRAVARWSRNMRQQYDPDEWLVGRFSRTTRIDILRLRQTTLNSSAGTATVAVSLLESRNVEPSPRSFAGTWELVRVNGRWLLNEPHF